MAVKRTIHEKCPVCGERNARLVGSMVYVLGHRCPNDPPGPVGPYPYEAQVCDVIWMPGDFDVEFLRRELDEAHLTIMALRSKRWRAERAAQDAVAEAMKRAYAS